MARGRKKQFRTRQQTQFKRCASAWKFPSTRMGKTYREHMQNCLSSSTKRVKRSKKLTKLERSKKYLTAPHLYPYM